VLATDKTAKKLAFVRQVILELKLDNLEALHGRIELLPSLGASLGTAKAVGALPMLLAWWTRHRVAGSPFLALKGPAWEEELPVPGWSIRAHPYRLPTRGERFVVEAW
jgi:16S rRNA (guanine527-N7)-methyltransferase